MSNKTTTFDGDGWDCPAIADSGILDALARCGHTDYALRHCTRASASFGDTLADLRDYARELAQALNEAADALDLAEQD